MVLQREKTLDPLQPNTLLLEVLEEQVFHPPPQGDRGFWTTTDQLERVERICRTLEGWGLTVQE